MIFIASINTMILCPWKFNFIYIIIFTCKSPYKRYPIRNGKTNNAFISFQDCTTLWIIYMFCMRGRRIFITSKSFNIPTFQLKR